MSRLGSFTRENSSPRNLFANAVSLGKLASNQSKKPFAKRKTPLELAEEAEAKKKENQGRARSGSQEVRDLRQGFMDRQSLMGKKASSRQALAASPMGRRLIKGKGSRMGMGNSWLDNRIVQRAASRTNSLARVMSNSGSFMRADSMNSSFLDPTKSYTKHVRKAAAHREMSLSTLEFSRLWEKAADSGWEEAMKSDDDVVEVDVDENKEARRGTSQLVTPQQNRTAHQKSITVR